MQYTWNTPRRILYTRLGPLVYGIFGSVISTSGKVLLARRVIGEGQYLIRVLIAQCEEVQKQPGSLPLLIGVASRGSSLRQES